MYPRYTRFTHLVLNVVVDSRHSVVLGGSRVEQAQALHGHGVDRVGDGLVQVGRQLVRSKKLTTRGLGGYRAAQQANEQRRQHLDTAETSENWQRSLRAKELQTSIIHMRHSRETSCDTKPQGLVTMDANVLKENIKISI